MIEMLKKSQKATQKIVRNFRRVTKFAASEEKTNFSFEDNINHRSLTELLGLNYKRFSHLLPYRYYDEEDGLFINEGSIAVALEVAPLSGANEEIINALSELIKNRLDHTVCAQVMLVGNHKIGHYLEGLLRKANSSDPIFAELARRQIAYLEQAAIKGFYNKRGFNMRLKDHRCFIFLSRRVSYNRTNAAKLCGLRDDLMTDLKSSQIHNEALDPLQLITLVKTLINPELENVFESVEPLDKYQELHEQVVDKSFGMKVYPNRLETTIDGEAPTQIVSLSLKKLPEEIALWTQAELYSNIFKPNFGIPCPFVISVHFKCAQKENSKLMALRKSSELEKKARSPYAKLIPGTVKAAEDWLKIKNDLYGDQINLCKIFYNCTLYTTAQNRREDVSKTMASFQRNGFDLYAVRYQQLQSYLALLPFVAEEGIWWDLSAFGRLNTMTTWNLTNLLPLISDYKGPSIGKGILAPTFRGQVAQIDNFAEELDSFNVCISATSGAGKSVLSQALISSVLDEGGKVWVIDLGESYKKLCETLGGTYLDVDNLALNPFSGVSDINRSAESIRDLISVMASPGEGLGDVQRAHLLEAVRWAYSKNKNEATIDDVIEGLRVSEKKNQDDFRVDDIITLLKKYSPSLSPKASAPVRIFNQASMLESKNAAQERLVVLELGGLEGQPDLMKAVLFALILDIEEQMYRGISKRKKCCVIDEAWRLFSGSNKVASSFIEKGYRTARKYDGCFVTISQKINDFYNSSEAQAAWSCSDTKIIMRQDGKFFEDFLLEKPGYFKEYEEKLIKSFRPSKVNGFSEFMIQQGSHSSFHRLFLDPFARIMYSSASADREAVNELIRQGDPIEQAISLVANNQFSDEINAISGRA